MNRYELTYIIDTALEENARKELIEKFSALIAQNGGEVEKVDETWGKRRLAYAINDKPEGYYVLVTFKGPSELPREIERNMGISEDVLRCLIIKLEEKKHSVKPRPCAPRRLWPRLPKLPWKPLPLPRSLPKPPLLNKDGVSNEQIDHHRQPHARS